MADKIQQTRFLSSGNWIRLKEAPKESPELEDGEYTLYYGVIGGNTSYFVVAKSGGNYSAHTISIEKCNDSAKLLEKLEKLGFMRKDNERLNRFIGWTKCAKNETIPQNTVKVLPEGLYLASGINSGYSFRQSDDKYGRQLDWVQLLGVSVP